MSPINAIRNFGFGRLLLTQRIAASAKGRILLHTLCVFRHPSHLRWHWHGIVRETNYNLLVALLVLALAWCARAQTPCPGADTCPGSVAQMVCPAPGSMLPGNDVTFTWCNANADYFLQIESIPGAHDIFYGLVPAQNFVHLLNLPTNGVTIYVMLWTQVHGQWQTPLAYTYAATNALMPKLIAQMLGTNGHFQFTIVGITPGRTNVVQASSDLVTWTSLSTNVPMGTSLPVVDPTASNFSRRYYRAFELR